MDKESKKLLLEYRRFKLFTLCKERNSVFALSSIMVNSFKNIFKILNDLFTSVTLQIKSDGIRIIKGEPKQKTNAKLSEINSLFYFAGIFNNTPLILSDMCDNYMCGVDTVFINLVTNELDVFSNTTDDSIFHLFINKENYNAETNKASCIQIYIFDYDVSVSKIIINCKDD